MPLDSRETIQKRLCRSSYKNQIGPNSLEFLKRRFRSLLSQSRTPLRQAEGKAYDRTVTFLIEGPGPRAGLSLYFRNILSRPAVIWRHSCNSRYSPPRQADAETCGEAVQYVKYEQGERPLRTQIHPQRKTAAGTNARAIRTAEGGVAADPVVKPNGKDPDANDKAAAEDETPFFDHLVSLRDRLSSGSAKIYLYRLWPEIDAGEKHYIGIVREPIDEDFLLRHYGSGKYMLLVKNPPHKPRTFNVPIHNPEYPPNVDAALVLSSPVNDRYFKTWAAKPNGAASKPEKESPGEPDIAGIIRASREGNKLEPQVIEWLQNMADRRDDLAAKLAEGSAKNPASDLASLLTAVKGIMPAPVAAPPPAQIDMAALLRLVKELQPPPPPPAPNPLQLLEQAKGLFSPPQDDLSHIDRLLGIADKLSGLRGGAAGGPRSAWDVGLDYVKELVPLAPYLGNLMGLRIPGRDGTPAPGAATATTPAQPAAFDPYQRPDLLRQHAQGVNGATGQAAAPAVPLPGTAPPAAPPAAAPANGAAAQPNDLLPVFQQYGALVVNALNNGTPGYDFADYVCGLLGKGTHAMIAAHGEDALVATMKSIPEIALFGEPRLRAFTAEFIDFERYLNEMAEETAAGGQAGASA